MSSTVALRFAVVSINSDGELAIADTIDNKIVTPEGTIDPTGLAQICATMNAADLLERRRDIAAALEALADERAPLTFAEVCPDTCNIPDHTIRMEISRYMDRWDCVDVSDLEDENGHQDIEAWEFRAGGVVRYEVREIPDPDYEPENEEDESRSVFAVVDTENDDEIMETFTDEEDADREAEDKSRDHRLESLYGFPFANNYARIIHERDIDDFAAAGFLVWENNVTGKLYAGIDGGGYSYEGAHFAPLWWRAASRGGWLVETETGPRRVRSTE
jgi:hypothetical protein